MYTVSTQCVLLVNSVGFFFSSLFIYYLFLVCTESSLLHEGFF